MITIVSVGINDKVCIQQHLTPHQALALVKRYLTEDEFGFYLLIRKFIVFYPNGKTWEKHIN